jgi:hypothetical protein
MKNQTAVEWLFEQVVNLDWKNIQGENKLEIFNQAKELEKQQIIEAYSNNGWNDEDTRSNAEQYYNETYEN